MTLLPSGPPVFTRTPHLVALVAEAERLAATIAAASPDASVVDDLHAEAALASLRLDGSRLTEVPDLALARQVLAGRESEGASGVRRGTWLDVLRTGEVEDEELAAVEYLAVRSGIDADDLAEPLLHGTQEALAELHRRLTTGLLPPAAAGVPRVSDQAVHDASVGRVVYFTAEPREIPKRLALVASWLSGAAAREHGLIVSGVVHLELLTIHPYEAANGRLARTAARLILRARGLDPSRLALAEPVLATDALGYHEEVARTLRRRDLTIWLERWGEAVAAGLRRSARRLGLLPSDVPERPRRFVEQQDEPRFTVVDYRAGAAVGPEEARVDLERLLDAGRIRRVPGSRGLRFEVSSSRR